MNDHVIMYPIQLINIREKLRIRDLDDNDAESVAQFIASGETSLLASISQIIPRRESTEIVGFLPQHKIDVIEYRNSWEDIGQVSFNVINTDCIKSGGSPRISTKQDFILDNRDSIKTALKRKRNGYHHQTVIRKYISNMIKSGGPLRN